ncbi:uncharacterized protein L201_002972 [Kwoniella dendrophila CBS 6074]|uniref:Cysteine-rich transmembrane CYSTM domain-containing protein n=1 Tax=Kwoniella dendrophila CBS 6074 TaxID=1295534 RepID=A0AAX4JT50_9TREE
MCTTGAQSRSKPSHIGSQPTAQEPMTTSAPKLPLHSYLQATPSERALSLNFEQSNQGSFDGLPEPSLSSTSSSSKIGSENDKNTKYEEWYPGDASNNGRPYWWNKLFCCGYGLGCFLCPCSSWNCKHERN